MVQNKVMRCTVRGAESKNAIIKVTQFINNLIQEAELGLKSLALYTRVVTPHVHARRGVKQSSSSICLLSVVCYLPTEKDWNLATETSKGRGNGHKQQEIAKKQLTVDLTEVKGTSFHCYYFLCFITIHNIGSTSSW